MRHLTPRRSARSRLLLAAPLAAVALLTAACGGGSSGGHAGGGAGSGSKPSPTPSSSASSGGSQGGAMMIDGQKVNNHGAKTVTGMSSVKMEMDDFYFEPSVLKGKPGQKITVQLDNQGKAEHTFTLPGQHLDKVVQPGQKATVTVTFPTKTTLFICRFHAQLGMRGALETTAGSSGGSGAGGGY